jgi:hypothetical protein
MEKGSSAARSAVEKQPTVRDRVKKRREELFRSGWRNPKELQPLVSREEDNAFHFLIEWCEEYEEVMSKKRDRLSDPTPRSKRTR